jgi:hypothetical protein
VCHGPQSITSARGDKQRYAARPPGRWPLGTVGRVNYQSRPPDLVGCPEGFALLRLHSSHAALLSEAIEESLDTWLPWISAEPLPPGGRAAMLERYSSAWEAGDAFHYDIL